MALFHHPDLAEIFHHAGMDQRRVRRGGNRVRGRRLAGLRQFLAQRGLTPVQRTRQPVRDVVGQAFAREHKTP